MQAPSGRSLLQRELLGDKGGYGHMKKHEHGHMKAHEHKGHYGKPKHEHEHKAPKGHYGKPQARAQGAQARKARAQGPLRQA